MSKILLVWGFVIGGFFAYSLMAATSEDSSAPVAETTSETDTSALNPEGDPFQAFNRAMFQFHQVLDGILIGPMANVYQDGMPPPVKNRISNFLNNIKEPWTLINDALQGEGEKGLVSFSRFMINTVFGLLGLFDVAGSLGLEGHQSNFGQTLGAWGVPSGPYIFVPVLGPNTLRSLVGRLVGYVGDPYNMALEKAHRSDMIWATIFIDGLVKRADSIAIIEDLQENSLDLYIGWRSSYLQYEEGQITQRERQLQPNFNEFLLD